MAAEPRHLQPETPVPTPWVLRPRSPADQAGSVGQFCSSSRCPGQVFVRAGGRVLPEGASWAQAEGTEPTLLWSNEQRGQGKLDLQNAGARAPIPGVGGGAGTGKRFPACSRVFQRQEERGGQEEVSPLESQAFGGLPVHSRESLEGGLGAQGPTACSMWSWGQREPKAERARLLPVSLVPLPPWAARTGQGPPPEPWSPGEHGQWPC